MLMFLAARRREILFDRGFVAEGVHVDLQQLYRQ